MSSQFSESGQDLMHARCQQGTTLKSQIAGRIRSVIFEGKLLPGSTIVESKLAKQLNVAQSTVREALQELEAQGLVVKYVNRKTEVRRMNREDLEKLQTIRLHMECLAAQLAHANANEQALASLSMSVHGMREAASSKAYASFYQYDIEFHQKIAWMADNSFLAKALEPLSFAPFAYVLAGGGFPLPIDYLKIAEDHDEVVEALRQPDAACVRALLQAKIKEWNAVQLASFAEVVATGDKSIQD